MKINTVALMGAGAVGAYFTYNMLDGMGEKFCVVAEGERKERLEKKGVLINNKVFFPTVKTPAEAHGVDLLLIATKYDGLKEGIAAVQQIVGKHTLVMSLLNGIDSEDVIKSAVGKGHVIRAFMKIVASRSEKGIRFNNEKTWGAFFGEEDGQLTDRVQAVSDVFTANGVHHKVSGHIIQEQWNKFAMNIANNLPQAVLGVGYGAYHDSEHMHYIHQKVMDEVIAVANAKGIDIYDIPTPKNICPPKARFSTLQDLDAKRPTETDMFMGAFLAEAKTVGIDVPFCDYTYHALKVLEEKNAGKFDY